MSFVCAKHEEYVPDGKDCRWCEPSTPAISAKMPRDNTELHQRLALRYAAQPTWFTERPGVVGSPLDYVNGRPAKERSACAPVYVSRETHEDILRRLYRPAVVPRFIGIPVVVDPSLGPNEWRLVPRGDGTHGFVREKSDTAGWPLRDGPEGA